MNFIEPYRKAILKFYDQTADTLTPYFTEENKNTAGKVTVVFGTIALALIYLKYNAATTGQVHPKKQHPVGWKIQADNSSPRSEGSLEPSDGNSPTPSRSLFNSERNA